MEPKTKHRRPKLIAATVKLAAASFNHGSGALIRALNVMGTPAGTNAFKVYGEIDRGREASEMMKKSGVKRGPFAEKKGKGNPRHTRKLKGPRI